MKKRLRAVWSIAIPRSRIFRVAVESQGMVLSDVDVMATLRIVPDEDTLVEIFPTGQPVPRSVLRARL